MSVATRRDAMAELVASACDLSDSAMPPSPNARPVRAASMDAKAKEQRDAEGLEQQA
jgi:hypothetical protein